MNVPGGSDLNLFDLSNEDNGWKGKAKSGLKIQNSQILINNSSRKYAVNGVQRLKFVAVRANKDADWSVEVYHFDGSEPIHTYTVSKTALPDIKYITNNSWVASGRSIALTVNKFKVEIVENPTLKITSATDGNVAYNAPLSVTFDSAIDDTTISGIQLKQGATVVNANVALDEETKKTVTITPTSPLVDEQKYQIVIPTTVKGVNGLSVEGETAINITAVDAIYYTNAGSAYNPTGEVTATDYKFEDGKLILTGSAQFPTETAVTSGVYYFDLKHKVTNYYVYFKMGFLTGDGKSLSVMEMTNDSKIRSLVIETSTYTYESKYNNYYHVMKPLYDPSTIYYATTDKSNKIFD